MAIALAQAAVTGSGATLVINGVTAGNALFVIDSYFRSPSNATAATTPTDSNGTFSIARAGVPGIFVSGGTTDDVGVGIWYQANAAAGTHTVTPQALTSHHGVLLEFSGMATTSLFDQANDAKTNDSNQTSQVTGTTPATTVANELVLIGLCLGAAIGVANVVLTDPVSGFTTVQVGNNDSTDIAFLQAYQIISATGAQSATFNWTDTEAHQGSHAAIATFAGAASQAGNAIGSNAFHPGRSPGLGGISSARFAMNWWPYSPPVTSVFDPALMEAMNKFWPDTIIAAPQVVASGMTPPDNLPN